MKARKWLCGRRGAARGWEKEYTTRVQDAGFVPGKYGPAVFRKPTRDVRCVIHGDDFMCALRDLVGWRSRRGSGTG